MDCSKSTELYEQSAEQLAEEEKKRADARKIKSEYHRTAEQQDNADYYENTQNVDYDGRQNGRTNPYGQSAVNQNQIPAKQEESNPHFRSNSNRDSGRYFQENSANALRTNEKTSQPSESFNQQPKQRQYHDGGSNYQTNSRQRNQLMDTQGGGKSNYEQGNKFQDTWQNYQSNSQDYRSDQNTARNSNEKPGFRDGKSRPSTRNNLFGSNQSQKSTPVYMETTTFRTTTSVPPKEYQQFAESAAFVSNRGGRFNSAKSESNRQFYYHSYDYHDRTTTVDYRDHETTTLRNQEIETVSFTPKTNAPAFPGPTFAPIYKPKTTTLPPYETTLQYTPTTETSFYTSTSYYGQDDTPEITIYDNVGTVTSSSVDEYSSTESYSDLQTPPAIGRVPPLTGNYQNQQYKVTNQRDTERDTASFGTTRPYINTESYRQNVPTNVTSANYQNENNIADIETKGTTRDPWRASSQNFRQNSISSTEKPWKSTNAYQPNGSTSKTLSPYDTSFTYKQGKVLSTLGPYIPFTKNYIYSTMTTTPTPKPSATAPTYSSTLTNYRITASSLLPKMKSLSSVTSKPKDRATYLPEASSKRPTTFEDRPYAEREHALSMLHSLQGLENNANGLSELEKKSGSDRNPAPGPSTLHSLALYFATAGDNLDLNETFESTASIENREVEEEEDDHNVSIELPINILTQHTIASYAELFNLNNALEGNATIAEFAAEVDNVASEIEDDDDDDLEIEQSEGPLNGAKRSNNTKLRELAQVFTHALSAYLQDPDTFKKVLTEIRPTLPPTTTIDGDQYETTTLYPTTAEEYSSVTKEKDEVLDFSDDTDASRRRKPSTVFSTTLQPPTITDRSYLSYYTTPYEDSTSETRRPVYYPSTTLLPPGSTSSYESEDYVESSTQSGNTFAFEVNRAFTTTIDNIHNYDSDTRDSTDLSPVYDNYFPLDENENRNKISRNNTAKTFQPYGKNVKPKGATPITNYVASSTLATFHQPVATTSSSWGKGSAGDKPVQDLTPPHYQRFGNVRSFEVSNSIVPNQIRSTTPLPRSKSSYDTTSTTVQPFRIRYYDSTTTSPEGRKTSPESLVTARSSYVKYRNSYNRIENNRAEGNRKSAGNLATTAATTIRDNVGTLDPITATVSDVTPYTSTVVRATSGKPIGTSSTRPPSSLNNDHWTSSPMVTQLWETTVFVDPRHINHGLQSSVDVARSPTTDNSIDEETERAATTTRSPTFTEVDLDGTTEARTTSTPSPWQWATNGNDSPVTFTLLPTTFAAENTATPTPIITTHASSITTTITSSVTSTNSIPRDNLASTLLPFSVNALNTTENEVIKAQEMFGKLNETSSNTLMRVMKQADSNETVRQLVLLLISHCNAPKDKTTEQEKEQLLDALLRLPVSEFSSEESREIVAGITRLNLPSGTLY